MITVTVAAGLLAGCSVFGVRSGYEQPPYEVVEEIGDAVEVRRYGARVAAESRVETADRDEGMDDAFMLLFDYITGANQTEASIAMTAPVETSRTSEEIAMTVPVESARNEDGTLYMRFFLPAEYDAQTAPKPVDPNVSIVALPEQTFATLRFTGFGGESTVAEKKRELLAALGGTPWRPTAEPVALFYDPPWTIPFLRRNEVAVAVER